MISHFNSAQASLLARHFSFAVKQLEPISLILFLLRFSLKGIENIQNLGIYSQMIFQKNRISRGKNVFFACLIKCLKK